MAGEKKRTVSESEEQMQEFEGILVDIEGTTSSISFVKDELFPYVREFLKKHVEEKWDTEEFKKDFSKLKDQAKEDEAKKVDGLVPIKEDTVEEAKESLIKNVLWQMDNDRKAGALKSLQGHMWKAAYKPIKGHVYDDVPEAFKQWTDSGKKIYVYSSGSVEAQKLLFGDSLHGDLTKYLSNYFDTTIGHKQEVDSYKNILKEIRLEPSKLLFLTDVVKEAEAAKKAGLSTAIVIREGNAKLSEEEKVAFKTINSFAEMSFPKSQKRQKLEEDVAEKKDTSQNKKLTTDTEAMDTSEISEVTDEKKKDEILKDENVENSKVEITQEEAEKAKEKSEQENSGDQRVTDTKKIEKEQISAVKSEEKMIKSEEVVEKTEKESGVEEKKVTEKSENFSNESENSKTEDSKTENDVESEKVVQKSEKEETKENGKLDIDQSENKKNVQCKEETQKKLEPEVELAEEAKESNDVEKEKETKLNGINFKTKPNGVTFKTKQNGGTEEAKESDDVKKVEETNLNSVNFKTKPNGVTFKAKQNGDTEEAKESNDIEKVEETKLNGTNFKTK